MLKKLFLLIRILPKLGYQNVAYMAWYRLSLKLGLRKLKFNTGNAITGDFFRSTSSANDYPDLWKPQLKSRVDDILKGKLTFFHYHTFLMGNPPNWFKNPFNNSILKETDKHWTDLNDFDLNTGDIKILWEQSRFRWLTDLARAYKVFGDSKYLITLNEWLSDWSEENPKNIGVNWKCGQEVAIRLMKLISTAQILDQDLEASSTLIKMSYEHVERINGNINYAIAQDNNHGPSEAAALFIGSVWLLRQKEIKNEKKLEKFRKKGRGILVNRILRLVDKEGTFAQQSVNYHRLVVDTMSWVFYNMNRYGEKKFNEQINQRLLKLGEWQIAHIANEKGNPPNLGPNDGAMLENLHTCDYRDFRPSTQLYFATFLNVLIYKDVYKPFNESLYWRFGKTYKNFHTYKTQQKNYGVFDNQFLYIKSEEVSLYMRLPGNKLRPTSEDAFHIDLWVNGINVICDTGSYSYNAGRETDDFKSVAAHNTIQFDDQPQMPKISRFLYGGWLNASIIKPLEEIDGTFNFSASYRDYNKNEHKREFKLDVNNKSLLVIDSFDKSNDTKATASWHTAQNSNLTFKVTDQKSNILEPKITAAKSSLYYLEKHSVRKLQFSTKTEQITTLINF